MTAVVIAMLAIVMVATAVLAAVGGYHHLANSPWVKRKLRRWRYVASGRLYGWRETGFHALRVLRRSVAGRLSPSAAPSLPIMRHSATRGGAG